MFHKTILLLISTRALAEFQTFSPTNELISLRGVPEEDLKLYDSKVSDVFNCRKSPGTVPFHRVNDDFCDCADCSDEPSTSASASLDRVDRFGDFHCRNVGHRPGKLSYTDVDDGRCNYQKCCDGSDESAVVDGKPLCPNRCEELGELWRMVEKRVNDIRLKASNVKTKLVKDAAALKKGVEEKIKSEEIKIEGTEANVKHWETKLKEAEELSDKHKTASPRSKVAEAVQLAKDQVEKYKTLLTELKEQRDDAEGRLKIVEAILKKYKEEYKPSYNLEYGDQSGKNVIAAWETYLTGRASADRELNEADDKELNDLISGGTINWDGMIPEAGATEDTFLEKYLPKEAIGWINSKTKELRAWLVANSILVPRDVDDGSIMVTSSRQGLENAEREHNQAVQRLEELRSDLTQYYGPDDIFRALKGKCISGEFADYRYEYCFMEKALQISLKDSSQISLGGFSRLEHKDENSENEGSFQLGLDGSYTEPVSGMVLKHENGQHCWNGPARSVSVHLYCNVEDEIRSVVEREMCTYDFEVGTPAACKKGEEKGKGGSRDEL